VKEKKELWPGAGIYLEFIDISDEDFEKVEQRLSELDGLGQKIIFMNQLLATYGYGLEGVMQEFGKRRRALYDECMRDGLAPGMARERTAQARNDRGDRLRSLHPFGKSV
jgi:hypothetical protein